MSKSIPEDFLDVAGKLFRQYKKLAEGAFAQLSDADIQARPNDDSNSIALIVHHLSGNMISRWTDFLTSDGEKSWRQRDAEFEDGYSDKRTMMEAWEKGWDCLFAALNALTPDDLSKSVYIRGERHSVLEAITRQLAHYPHHIGQILFQAKALKGSAFTSLSIPKRKP